jgi:Na+-transporting methylmalonyl-CoA/oxaloacetate decarboxylase gamma subunit
MVEVFGVVVVTLFVGLLVWSMRYLASVASKDARHAPFDEANSEQERT